MSNDKKETKALREKQVTNIRVINSYMIIAIVLTLSYIIEIVKGARTIPYVLFFLTLLLVPLVITVVAYKKNDESEAIKYISAIGYGIFYMFTLVTTTSIVGFVFVLPMLTALTLYKKYKFSLFTGIGATIMNIGYVIYRIVTKDYVKGEIADFEIQIACMILVTIFITLTARTLDLIFQSKLDIIEKEKEKQEMVTNKIISASQNISKEMDDISLESKQMEEQLTRGLSAIEQIASGTLEVANNIQNQMEMSTHINEMTNGANNIVNDVLGKFSNTKINTSNGVENMAKLSKAAEQSQASCSTVEETISELTNKITEVESILQLIEGITKQTSLLSLNASIEAARAGESGRGFAVVAGNIQDLAEKTKNATEDIKKIFDELNTYNQNTVKAVSEMENANQTQHELILLSKENFEQIEKDIHEMTEDMKEQSKHMNIIMKSNAEIGGSIENVSAFTEELTASADNTKQLTSENLEGVKRVNMLIDEVLEEVKSLA